MVRLPHQVATAGQGNLLDKVKDDKDNWYSVKAADTLFLNGASAHAADSFCGLLLPGSQSIRENHQNKHIKNTVDKDLYLEELKKAARQSDVFILYTTHHSTVTEADLPPRGAIVSKANMKDYFGPFAARAFCDIKININQATHSQLEMISGIGTKTATSILQKRKEAEFTDKEDFKRCKLSPHIYTSVYETFIFPQK